MADDIQARMERIGNVVLDYTYYEGQDFYTDGEIEDEMLDIAMNNPAAQFPEIIEARRSWPVFYHFSPLRANIIDWIPFRCAYWCDRKESRACHLCGFIEKAQSGQCLPSSRHGQYHDHGRQF